MKQSNFPGMPVRLQGVFTDNTAAVPFNPATVTLIVQAPNAGAVTTIVTGFLNPTVGTYQYDFVPDIDGQWLFKYVGSLVVGEVTNEGEFYVSPSRIKSS